MKYYFFTFFFISSLLSFSQETDKKSPFSGNFDLGLNFTKNTESTLQFNNIFLVKYQKNNFDFNIGNNIAFISKTGENELLNKGVQDIKFSYKNKKLSTDISIQHLYDISKNIERRWTSGLGFSYVFLQKEEKKLGIGLYGLKEKEKTIDGAEKIQNRMSANLDFSLKFNKSIELTISNQYQPNIEEVGDFRTKSIIALRVNLSPQFLLSINNTFNYDSFPEEGIPETDYQLINSISYSF